NPAQGIELVSTFGDVREKSGELEGANVELNANRAELLLKNGSYDPWRLLGRRFDGESEAHAIPHRISGSVEQGPRLGRIVGVVRYLTVICPVLWGKNAVGWPGSVAP